MRSINVWALILVIAGLIIALLGWPGLLGESSGYITMGVAYSLIAIGILVWIIGLFTKKK